VDFPKALVEGIITRMEGRPPEAMARVTVYLNTARMLRRVRTLFDDYGSRFLPRLRLVTDIGRDPLAGLPPAVPPLRRRLELAELVAGLLAQDTGIAPGTAVFDLADSLASLMAEMQDEGVEPIALAAPDLAENHAAHWERSLAFIRIVARYFGTDIAPDPESRQRKLVEALIQTWSVDPPKEPVIVAGSTGSRGTTAMFMRAVSQLPQGAVILPGFDRDMPEFAWNSLYSGTVPAEDHPQFRFWQLTHALKMSPLEIHPWSGIAAPDPARNRVISLALRPAPVTDQWMVEGSKLGDLGGATEGLSLIEAPTPQAEALAIALCLRHAAETGVKAALVSPDRVLTRRVAAALDRWSIIPDDSAGEPLAQTAPGRFLRHVADLLGSNPTADTVLTILKHPLTATGAENRGNHLRFTRDLELRLRRKGPAFPKGDDIRVWAAAEDEVERSIWANWLAETLDQAAAAADGPLIATVETHLALAERLASGPGGLAEKSELWREEAGRVALTAMSELRREAEYGGRFTLSDYARLVSSILANGTVRRIKTAHPQIAIWGTLEARVMGADLVILAGLNEGTWPKPPAPDPWLSRQMRQKIGLLLPERQIGLSAHDFQQAVGAPRVILSRAIRDAEAETVPSRWLARLTNLLRGLPEQGGVQAFEAMMVRGAEWLRLAAALETPSAEQRNELRPAPRPAPRPPVAARPNVLPVTGIRTLIRDPYAIYARRILQLKPLDPLRAQPDARLRGQVLHKIVEDFIRQRPRGETEKAARDRLIALAGSVLSEEIPWPSAQRIWLAKLTRVADKFIASEAQREARGMPVILEKNGSVSLESGKFILTARPDRIDMLEDGQVHIYDYKTGEPPSKKQQEVFDKQLLLEAAMAERGGFAELGRREVAAVTYIQIGGDAKERETAVDVELLAKVWDQLHLLISAYQHRETGYASRRAVFESRREGDYDHLARFGEWQMSDPPEPEDVG
jgi:ATP-dependent helicase/nuclease subunit B